MSIAPERAVYRSLDHVGLIQAVAEACGLWSRAGKPYRVIVESDDLGSQSMLNTWWMWMAETAQFMAAQGCYMPMYHTKDGKAVGRREFSAEDAHELFTGRYLGRDEQGRRKSWSRSKSADEVQASMGDRLYAMDSHLAWATDKGIRLTIPDQGQYAELKRKEAA